MRLEEQNSRIRSVVQIKSELRLIFIHFVYLLNFIFSPPNMERETAAAFAETAIVRKLRNFKTEFNEFFTDGNWNIITVLVILLVSTHLHNEVNNIILM